MRSIKSIKASIQFLRAELEKEEAALRQAETNTDTATEPSPEQFEGVDKTNFYPGKNKPGTSGVYERDYSSTDEPASSPFSFFDGVNWYVAGETPEKAALSQTISSHQELPWRGLTAAL